MLWMILTTGLAQADGLQWNWGEAPVRYRTEALVGTPGGYPMKGEANVEARATHLAISLDSSCQASPLKKGWNVDCTVERVALEAVAFPHEQARMDAIMAEYGQLLLGAVIELSVHADGRIRGLDLEGVSKKSDRHAEIHETLRQLLRRAFSALDIQTPKDPTAAGWKHKGSPLSFGLMSAHGTSGGVRYDYERAADVAGTTLIQGFGRGNVMTGLGAEADAGAIMNLIVSGQSRFDEAAGVLAYSEVSVTGELSAGSLGSGDPNSKYAMAAWVGRLLDDGQVEGRDGPGAVDAD
jgi:hypothetical protein